MSTHAAPPLAYLDHAATTPMRAEAVEAMVALLADGWGNPSGSHAVARRARRALDEARDVVAASLGCQPAEVVFTAGGTEADNLAVTGVVQRRGGVAVCPASEHHAVLHPVEHAKGRVVGVDGAGAVDLGALAEALDDDQLRWWASPDVEWDRIVEITPAGTTEVIDFTVPVHHNFVAADLYLHNTAFGLGMAVHVAQTTAKPVLVFSLEMGHNELTQRILSSEARVDSSKMRNGRISEADWGLIGRAIGRLEVPLFLDDNPRVTVMEIRAKARRLKARHGGLALIVIDYLQLMSGNGTPENRQLEVSEISRSLKILARELEVPIVALSQLSRNLEARADKRPMLSDLRESGSLEQDADVVMFLYRDEVYNAASPDKGSAEIIVAKHRSGPIGTKRLVYLGQYTRFDNAARGV